MYSKVRISLDSRYEAAYPDWWVDRSFRFYQAEPGWQMTLSLYPPDVVLVRRTQPVAQVMKEIGWKRIYDDRAFELYERNGLDLTPVTQPATVVSGRFP